MMVFLAPPALVMLESSCWDLYYLKVFEVKRWREIVSQSDSLSRCRGRWDWQSRPDPQAYVRSLISGHKFHRVTLIHRHMCRAYALVISSTRFLSTRKGRQGFFFESLYIGVVLLSWSVSYVSSSPICPIVGELPQSTVSRLNSGPNCYVTLYVLFVQYILQTALTVFSLCILRHRHFYVTTSVLPGTLYTSIGWIYSIKDVLLLLN